MIVWNVEARVNVILFVIVALFVIVILFLIGQLIINLRSFRGSVILLEMAGLDCCQRVSVSGEVGGRGGSDITAASLPKSSLPKSGCARAACLESSLRHKCRSATPSLHPDRCIWCAVAPSNCCAVAARAQTALQAWPAVERQGEQSSHHITNGPGLDSAIVCFYKFLPFSSSFFLFLPVYPRILSWGSLFISRQSLWVFWFQSNIYIINDCFAFALCIHYSEAVSYGLIVMVMVWCVLKSLGLWFNVLSLCQTVHGGLVNTNSSEE